jgi:hypothetical protein
MIETVTNGTKPDRFADDRGRTSGAGSGSISATLCLVAATVVGASASPA